MSDLLAIPFTASGILANGTPAYVVGARAAASRVIEFAGLKLGGNSVSANDANVTVEVCRATDLGSSTSFIPIWLDGIQTVQPATSGAHTFTAPPTSPVVIDRQTCSPSGGINDPQIRGREICSAANGAIVVRVTVPTGNTTLTVNGTLFVRGA